MLCWFSARDYVLCDRGLHFDGDIIKLVDAILPDFENRMVQCLYHHNCGYVMGEIAQSNVKQKQFNYNKKNNEFK
jgi:hypothetical protein